jgi:hypothetical protein
MNAYKGAVAVMAVATAALGVVLLAVTLAGGGGVGVPIGLLFVAAGGGRLYLLRRRS